MKKIVVLLLVAIIAVSSYAPCFAEENVDVLIDGTKIQFDVPAQVIDGRTMVPMRKIFETLGAQVEWYETEQGILALTQKGQVIVMKIGSKKMLVGDIATNAEKTIELDVAPMVINDRTLVPVRAISESLGYTVGWDEATATVSINR